MIGRAVWFAALAAIALITAALQIDKQSEVSPELATLVPPPLRNFAQTQIAASAAAGNDAAVAVTEAERLVRRRPIPAEYLSLLAVAQAKAGLAEQSGLTIQIAGQRGWRERLAQEAVLRLALDAGDRPEAARRYAALFLNDKTTDALLLDLGPAVLSEPGGPAQQTFVDIVAGGKRWYELYLRRGAQVMPPAAFAAITVSSMQRGADFDCDALKQSIAVLRQRDAAAATQLTAAAASRCLPSPAN